MDELDFEFSALITRQLECFPFHNLGQLLGKDTSNGGTCFDHALKLRRELVSKGFDATLHEAKVCLTGEKSHRLVRVEFNKKVCVLDSGSGWPTVYMGQEKESIQEYVTAGIRFKVITELDNLLIKRHDGRQWRDMNRISLPPQNQRDILDKFNNRYSQPLPYSNELRFCWLHDNRFHRIAGFNLSLYESGKHRQERTLTPTELSDYVHCYFPELTPDLNLYLESIN